jgi:hypothetical protein
MKTSNSRVRARTRDVSYQFRMPAGIPGDINRAFAATVEAAIVSGATPGKFSNYGLAGVINAADGAFRVVAAGDTVAYGFLARPFPTNSSQDALGTSTPATSGAADVLRRGYMTVKLYGATAAAKGGKAWIRIQNAGAGQIIGGVEAASDAANTIDANAVFMGPADSDGNVEIAYNI